MKALFFDFVYRILFLLFGRNILKKHLNDLLGRPPDAELLNNLYVIANTKGVKALTQGIASLIDSNCSNDPSKINLDRKSLVVSWYCTLGRVPSDIFIKDELKKSSSNSIMEYVKNLKLSEEYKNQVKSISFISLLDEDIPLTSNFNINDTISLFSKKRLGVVNWHKGFTANIQRLYPEIIVVDRNMPPDHVDNLQLDALINHHDICKNKSYGRAPYIALNYWTINQHHINQWNSDDQCIGIIDFSLILKIRFPDIIKPIRLVKPKYNDLIVYDQYGKKIITLVQNYKKRFETGYNLAKSITNDLCEGVNDVVALSDAKWLLHIRKNGFVCNAVMRALGSGVPVIMDIETWHNGFFGAHVRHNDNAIVLPATQIKSFLQNCPDDLYSRIKSNCVKYAKRDLLERELN